MSTGTVFFDLGNVLIFFSLEKMVAQVAACTGISEVQLLDYWSQGNFGELYETGQITSQQLFLLLQEKGSNPFTFDELMHAMADIFTPNEALWPLVEELHSKKQRLVLLSNTNECHFRFAYESFPILKRFDRFILSYQVRSCKPHPEIFRCALQEAQGRTFYTDDIPAFVAAGRNAGFDAELFLDVPTLRRQLEERGFLC